MRRLLIAGASIVIAAALAACGSGSSGSSSSGPSGTLTLVDTLQNAKATPWLATNWTWGNGNKTLTFTIRNGVKFTDGTPLSAADVAFTFNLMKKFPGLDIN